MSQKKHFTHAIQLKFLLLRIFIAGIILFVSGMGIFFVQKIAQDSAQVIENNIPLLQSVHEMNTDILSAGLHSMIYLNSLRTDEKQLQSQYDFDLQAELRGVHDQLDVLNRYAGTDPELSALIVSIQNALSRYEVSLNAAREVRTEAESLEGSGLVEEEESYARSIGMLQDLDTELQAIVGSVDQVEALVIEDINAEVARVQERTHMNQILITLISVLAVLTTLLVGLIFSNRTIVRPLYELTQTAEEMAEGKLTKRLDIRSGDEIGKLAYTFNKMATKLKSSYDDLEKIVEDKTQTLEHVLKQFETKNADLEKSQMATINLLEDLEDEKKAVEERVKQRTQELEQEKNKLLQVTSNMRGGGILLNEAQDVVFVNDATYSMIGIPTNVSMDNILGNFLSHFEGDSIKEHLKKCLNGETFRVPEIDGDGRVYEIFFHCLKNNGVTAGYFILFFDITDAKLLERSKSELVAVASHQLRTPLTAMRGNVEMLIDESFGSLNKEQHELLDDIEVSTIRLITMVNEMLDITKIERGDLEMHLEKLDIGSVITSVVTDLQLYAERHEFTISSEVVPDIYVSADKVRLRQVFQNLVDNAIKYSNHPGHLDIASRVEENIVEISFKDNGIGVPKNEQSKLFERFYRASNTAKTASSGSGLGLYIVRSIAEQLGGGIRFESIEGKGTTFYVTLPLSTNT